MKIDSFSKCRLIILLLVFGFIALQAQNIRGRVVDSKTQLPLPFASVFLNNTTIGTVTENNGEFNLTSINESGTYELVVSFVGYNSYKMKVSISEGILDVGTVKLIASEIQLDNLEVKTTRDKEWERKLKKFKKIFLGEDKLAASCTILNPWVIDFPEDDTGNKFFIAKASQPIEISNEGLGYKVVFHLTGFWSGGEEYLITGNVQFAELPGMDASIVNKWKANRAACYHHSTHHLFKSILEKRIGGEGFRLYTDKPGFKNATSRSSQFYAELDKTVIEYDTTTIVEPDNQKDFYRIKLKDRVEVHYNKERTYRRTYTDVTGMVSWITLNKGSVVVNKHGFPKRPIDVTVSGDMSSYRVARMLPLDYRPDRTISPSTDFTMYQEKIYVHIDKPYYYPGEAIWFKGYVNYAAPVWRDSLSRTVYVEIVDHAKKSIVTSKTLEITNGFFYNDFSLPDTLTAKTYYLRAYTNFNRNFGDDNLFVKPLPVLNLTDRVNPDKNEAVEPTESILSIVSDKSVYKPREKITLTLKSKDDDDNPISANLSLSVVDSYQVAPIKISFNILEGYQITEIEVHQIKKNLPFPVEYGVTISGKFLNEKNMPEKTLLNVLQLNPKNFTIAQSDDQGLFTINGLSFYDTATFSIQPAATKGKVYGNSELINRETATIDFKESEYPPIVLSKRETPQGIPSEYRTPKDVTKLREVEVNASKIVDPYQAEHMKRPFGKPDYVLKAKDLKVNFGNLLQVLPGKIPGLVVREIVVNGQGEAQRQGSLLAPDQGQTNYLDELNWGRKPRWVVYLQRQTSGAVPLEVLITVNDAIVTGSPADILSSIDPSMVESIEVKTGINVLYGSVGGNGIIAIYTKTGTLEPQVTKDISIIKVMGYSNPHSFVAPEYGDQKTDPTIADYRSTLYWNPEVVTDAKTGMATVSFFAADLPGKYRIVAEGITEKNEPIRCEYSVEVNDQ